jgi:putative DNA primase/helicase
METDREDFDPLAPLLPVRMAPAADLAALPPPKQALLGPLVPGSIAVIRGPRGVGKSWLALAVAQAIAGGGALLGWHARPAPVLYVETAMSGALLGARLRALGPAPNLQVVCDSRIDLDESDDQARLMDVLPENAVLVLDGLTLLSRGRKGWAAFTDWLRMLRRAGHVVVLVEPTVRPAIAALADTMITLRRAAGECLAFSLAIASRQPLAAPDRAFDAALDLTDGCAVWRRSAVIPPELRAIVAAMQEGGTIRDVAARLGVPTTTVWRRIEKARALGVVAGTTGTSGTGGTGRTDGTAPADGSDGPTVAPAPRTADLAAVSTVILKRTLARRAAAETKAGTPPGPAILAGFADAELAAECARRLKPPQAARLMAQYAAAAE